MGLVQNTVLLQFCSFTRLIHWNKASQRGIRVIKLNPRLIWEESKTESWRKSGKALRQKTAGSPEIRRKCSFKWEYNKNKKQTIDKRMKAGFCLIIIKNCGFQRFRIVYKKYYKLLSFYIFFNNIFLMLPLTLYDASPPNWNTLWSVCVFLVMKLYPVSNLQQGSCRIR